MSPTESMIEDAVKRAKSEIRRVKSSRPFPISPHTFYAYFMPEDYCVRAKFGTYTNQFVKAVYHLSGQAIPTPDEVFGSPAQISGPRPPNLTASSPNLTASSPNLNYSRDGEGCLIADPLPLPVIDDLDALAPTLRSSLEAVATEPRSKGKVDRQVLISVVLRLCARHFVTLRCLALLVNRKPETLRDQYLTRLVRERSLTLAFPKTPTHERQAYCATETP